MTENKRYNIKPSNIVEDAFYIKDDEREHSFPTVDDKSHLIMYEKALNEQEERIKEETNRVIKLEQYVYTKLCPESEHYDEKVLSEIINTILGDDNDD